MKMKKGSESMEWTGKDLKKKAARERQASIYCTASGAAQQPLKPIDYFEALN
jgi:hypothetical protein